MRHCWERSQATDPNIANGIKLPDQQQSKADPSDGSLSGGLCGVFFFFLFETTRNKRVRKTFIQPYTPRIKLSIVHLPYFSTYFYRQTRQYCCFPLAVPSFLQRKI
ncbi:unnamed protein product [Rhizopus stolonifer]